ncbi:MAG: hypothetical protein CVU55_06930 [Deltaproteobacteria bacterium HGW-Deltaproteobacteria-13]|jgi:hypothetical protein|nr:MAG: hypothetical protein CVU55_06930 [Deltaproteobacteria bacterium HGW-Deltaproteobacteria-13]
MKINFKQTIVKLLPPNKIFSVLLTAAIFFFMLSSVSFAPTKPAKKLMSDAELSNIEGQSLFTITQYGSSYGTGSANVIRMDLGIDMEIMAHADSLKMGYYTNQAVGFASGGDTGWDNDLTKVTLGGITHTTTPLKLSGLFLELGFGDNGTTSTYVTSNTRKLNYIDVGSRNVNGQLSASLNTVTGLFMDVGTGQNSGVLLRQTASGTRTIHFTNELLSVVFASKYRYATGGGSMDDLRGIFQKIPNYNTNLKS